MSVSEDEDRDNRRNNRESLVEEDDNFLLLDFTILDTKVFISYITFLDKKQDRILLQFSKSGISGIQVISNDEKERIDNVSHVLMPEWKMYHYYCGTEKLKDYNSEDPTEASFTLKCNLSEFSGALKGFKAANQLRITYNNGDSELKVINKSVDPDAGSDVSIKFSRKKLVMPIEGDIVSPTYRKFKNMKSVNFNSITQGITKTKEKLAYDFCIKIQDTVKTEGILFETTEPYCKPYGSYNKRKEPTAKFKIDPQIMKMLSMMTKGFDKSFISISYNDRILKISFSKDYLLHEFYIIPKKNKNKK